MKAEAVPLGFQTHRTGADLDKQFAGHTVTPDSLRASTAAVAVTQGALRETHLKYHLSTVAVLSPGQIQRYAELRGLWRRGWTNRASSPPLKTGCRPRCLPAFAKGVAERPVLPSPVLNQGGRRAQAASGTAEMADNEKRAGLLYLVVSGGKSASGIGMVMVSLARFETTPSAAFPISGRQQARARSAWLGVAAPVFAGLDLQVDRVAVIDLQFGAGRQVKSERQLHQRDRPHGCRWACER